MTLAEVRAKREEIVAAAARHGARNVRVFGSVARGEARPDSDIDVLVAMDDGRSLFDLFRLRRELERLLGPDIDLVTEGALRNRHRSGVTREAVPL